MADRKPNRTEKIMALAATKGYNPAEAEAASKKLQLVPEGSDAVALIRLATRALEQANALPDIIEVADKAAAIRTYVKRVGAGIGVENEAAELVVRSERKAGQELGRMADAGERYAANGARSGHPVGRGYKEEYVRGDDSKVSLPELGVNENQSRAWQKLARLSDAQMQAIIDQKRELVIADPFSRTSRLALADFQRAVDLVIARSRDHRGGSTPRHPMDGPPDIIEPVEQAPYTRDITPPDEGDAWSADWRIMLDAARRLGDDLTHGWPVQGDRSAEAWPLVNDEINEAGRALLWFQKRVKEYMA